MMPQAHDPEDIAKWRVCVGCVAEPYLKAEIAGSGAVRRCHYCGKRGKTWAMLGLADSVDEAFARHFERTDEQSDAYDGHRRGVPAADAIADAAQVDEPVAADIRRILGDRHSCRDNDEAQVESPFADDAHYEERTLDDAVFRDEWNLFEQDLKTETRFFSATARATLDRVFKGLATHRTDAGLPVVIDAGPGRKISALFRARVFQSRTKLKEAIMRPDLEVGPPPPRDAVAGRMNAAGISVFYGAKNASAALAEVRPPVGSDVVIGRFKLLRHVLLLDLAALQEVLVEGSYFDPTYLHRLEHAKFLRRLGQMMARAVMPEDERAGYLVTQVIADYLANVTKLDGIIYQSVQSGGTSANVVLFHHAAGVEPLALPLGTELESYLHPPSDEVDETDYTVLEMVPDEPAPTAPPLVSTFDLMSAPPIDLTAAARPATLKLDPASLRVHHVARVKYAATVHAVSRHRMKQQKPGSKPPF